MIFTNDSLFLNFGRLNALPNEAENKLINPVCEGFRYGQKGTAKIFTINEIGIFHITAE